MSGAASSEGSLRPFDRATSKLSPAHGDFLETFSQCCPAGAIALVTTRSVRTYSADGSNANIYYLNGGEDAAEAGTAHGQALAASEPSWSG